MDSAHSVALFNLEHTYARIHQRESENKLVEQKEEEVEVEHSVLELNGSIVSGGAKTRLHNANLSLSSVSVSLQSWSLAA